MPCPTLPDPVLSGSDTEDSDFDASLSPSDTEGFSSGEDGKPIKKRKRAGDEEALASGDEGIVEDGRKKKRRKHKKKSKIKSKAVNKVGEDGDEESEEGVGARLRRRRDGKGERESKKKASKGVEASTVDVDALWARLNSTPSIKPAPGPPPDPNLEHNGEPKPIQASFHAEDAIATASIDTPASDMVTIKRTYIFAGTATTEEKLVPRESAEARLYLSTSKPAGPIDAAPSKPPLQRPLKRPSRFDAPASPSNDLAKATAALKAPLLQKPMAELKAERGQKLNTVEKSRLDWVGYVDKEKLKDELDKAEKAKGGYLDRMDFLGRSEMAREEGLREARKR